MKRHYLIADNGQVMGHTSSADNAQRWALTSIVNLSAVSNKLDLKELELDLTWNQLERGRYPYFGKVSVASVLEALYREKGASYTEEELLDVIAGSSWVSIQTALSHMKNNDYPYTDKPIIIQKVNGTYVRKT